MAADAPYRGARTRAPEIQSDAVPIVENPTSRIVSDNACDIQTNGNYIDALILGVEVMIDQQRRIMREQRVSEHMLDNELWISISSILTLVRTQTNDIVRKSEALERLGMQLARGDAA